MQSSDQITSLASSSTTDNSNGDDLRSYFHRCWVLFQPVSPLLKATIWLTLAQMVLVAILIALSGQAVPEVYVNIGEPQPLLIPVRVLLVIAFCLLLGLTLMVTGAIYSSWFIRIVAMIALAVIGLSSWYLGQGVFQSLQWALILVSIFATGLAADRVLRLRDQNSRSYPSSVVAGTLAGIVVLFALLTGVTIWVGHSDFPLLLVTDTLTALFLLFFGLLCFVSADYAEMSEKTGQLLSEILTTLAKSRRWPWLVPALTLLAAGAIVVGYVPQLISDGNPYTWVISLLWLLPPTLVALGMS